MNISPRRPLRQHSIRNDRESTHIVDKYLKQVHKYIFSPAQVKVWLYLGSLVLFSLLKDFNLVPESHFQSKKTILNVYFVKYGWGWTLAVMIPFIYLTSQLYTQRDDETSNSLRLAKNILRLSLSTILWYFWTSLFEYIDHSTGECEQRTFATKHLCRAHKHGWINSVDISGHTFLLIHSLLFMIEEVKMLQEWIKHERERSRSSNKKIKRYLRLNMILIGILTVTWELMLVATFLYFHTFLHKLIAALLAIFCWIISYRYFYKKFFLHSHK